MLSVAFREHLQTAYEKSSFESKRRASIAAEMSAPQLGEILRGKFDNSAAGPGLFNMVRLADALGTPLHQILKEIDCDPAGPEDFNQPQSDGPSVNDFMEAWWRGDRQLAAFDQLQDFFDLYEPPTGTDEAPRIRRLGRKTLFCLRLGTTDRKKAQTELDAMDLRNIAMVRKFHDKTVLDGVAMDTVFLDQRLTTRPLRVRASYLRLGLHVVDQFGNAAVLLHCAPIPV